MHSDDDDALTAEGAARRRFLYGTGALTTGFATSVCLAPAAAAAATTSPAPGRAIGATVPVRLNVNGHDYDLALEPRVTLLDALREYIGLSGTKKGCDRGQCGACTVLVDGRRINSCLTLAVMHEGSEITTIEGLGTPDRLHPMQAAFLAHDAFQCGYCTPGQICSAVGMLEEARAEGAELTPDLIRERMSGNICRCGAYPNIVAAIEDVL